MKRECRGNNKRKGIYEVMIIAIMLLSLLFVPNLDTKDTKQKVDKVESKKSVGATEKHYNPLCMEGIEGREGRYGSASGDGYWFDFFGYTDYNFYKGSWTDGNGNPYVKVAFRIDTSYGYEEDVNGVSKLVVDVPYQLTVMKSSMSVSSSGISVAYSNNDRKITFKFNNGLGYRYYYINYVCLVNTSQLSASVRNGSSKLYTVGTDATKSTYGCAYVQTPDSTSKLTKSPGLTFNVNTSSQTRIIYSDLTYKWVTNHCGYACGGVGTYYKGNGYMEDGDMQYFIRASVDLTETKILSNGDLYFNVNIPDVLDFIPGTVDVAGGNISYYVSGKTVTFVINKNSIQNKMYYMSYRARLNFDKLPKNYYANEDYATISITGTTYDVINYPEQVGSYGTWEGFGSINLDNALSAPRVRHYLNLSPNGGTINSGNAEYYRYGHVTTFTRDVTRNGYRFGGWASYNDDVVYSGVGASARYSKSFYAVWNANSYSVTLNPQGGTITSGNVTSYTYGKGATLPTQSQVSRPGYAFKGWYTNAAGTGSRIYTIGKTETGNKTYYAKWEQMVYTVTLEPNGGTINSGNISQYTYGIGATLPTNVTKHGHDFKGWYDNPGFSGSPVTKIEPSTTGNKKYYAKWTASVYQVKLHPNGGNFVPGTEVTSYTFGVGAKLPNALVIRRDGYEFGGWYDNPGFSGRPVTKISPTDTGRKEYWAKWIEFEIVLDSKLTPVYGLFENKALFKSNGVGFKVITDSTSSMSTHLGYTTSKTESPASATVATYRGRGTTIKLSDDMGKAVVRDRVDKKVYVKLKVDCKQFDGDNWVYYNVYVNKDTKLRFVASYEEW